MNKLLEFLKIYRDHYKVIILIPILLGISTYLFVFINQSNESSKNLYEARYSWKVLQVPATTIEGGSYIFHESGVVKPSKIKNSINRSIRNFLELADNANCDITIQEWYKGKFEVIPDDQEGIITLNLNDFPEEKIPTCQVFAYDYFLNFNLEIIDEIIRRKEDDLTRAEISINNLRDKIDNRMDKLYKSEQFKDGEKEYIELFLALMAGDVQLLSSAEEDYISQKTNLLKFSSLDKELELITTYKMPSTKAQDKLFSSFIAFLVGIIISLLYVSILESRKIGSLLS